MGKYLKKFENHTQYTTYTASTDFITPNVSLCVNENDVHYNPIEPPTPQHEYVEIGGIKWATMNIGAQSPTDYGLYFQWGDTQGYTLEQIGVDKTFSLSDYKWTNDGGNTYIKYNGTDGKAVLDASDDAAQVIWGGNWRIPTTEEFCILCDAADMESDWDNWTLKFTDKNDSSKSIVFPFSGYIYETERTGYCGIYWAKALPSSEIYKYYDYGTAFIYGEESLQCSDYTLRYQGCTIRPVLDD